MIEARNQQGNPVDWWFIYKMPKHAGRADNQGFDYFYFDPDGEELVLSPVGLDQQQQALAYTLSAIFNSPMSAGFLVYNDEHIDNKRNKSGKGHCKGILAFDRTSDSALLLLHSTPRFPALDETSLPDDEAIYGQTFLCISLPDYQTANRIAGQMLSQQNPQILHESSRIPTDVSDDEPLKRLFHEVGLTASEQSSVLKFESRAGKPFQLVAKSRKWGEDFWLDLVSPTLNCDLVVETWRRGAVTPLKDNRSSEFDEDVLSLNFKTTAISYQWSYTHDHAKWAVALNNDVNSAPWVCVADINRMVSQEKRGGGALCFQEPGLWRALSQAEQRLHGQA